VVAAAIPAETRATRPPGRFFAAACGDHDAVLERVAALPNVGSAAASPSYAGPSSVAAARAAVEAAVVRVRDRSCIRSPRAPITMIVTSVTLHGTVNRSSAPV